MKENKSIIIVAKVTMDEINSIVETLLPKLYQGINMQKKSGKHSGYLTNLLVNFSNIGDI